MISKKQTEQFIFIDKETNYVVYPLTATFNADGTFATINGYTNLNTIPKDYDISNLTCISQFIFVPNIGRICSGDIIKLNEDDTTEYVLDFGWYVTNEGLDLYGWYLYSADKIKPFYQSYINTLKVVKFSFKH